MTDPGKLVPTAEPSTGGEYHKRFLIQQGRPQPKNMRFKLAFCGVVGLISGGLVGAGFVFPGEDGPSIPLISLGCIIGILFVMVAGVVLDQLVRIARATASARRHPDQPAMCDWTWDEEGFGDPRGADVGRRLLVALLVACPVSAGNWWVWFAAEDPPVIFYLIVVAATGFVTWLFAVALYRLFLTWHYPGARLHFDGFPRRRNGDVPLRWTPPAGLQETEEATFTLMCVHEYFVTTGGGRSQKTEMYHESTWRYSWHLVGRMAFTPEEDVELKVETDEDWNAPPTCHAGEEIYFWKLEVHIGQPGPDYRSWFKVPVY